MLLLHPWADSGSPAQGSGSEGSHRPPAPECPGLVYWEGGPIGSGALGWGPGSCLVGFLPPVTLDPVGSRPANGLESHRRGGRGWAPAPVALDPLGLRPANRGLESHGRGGRGRGAPAPSDSRPPGLRLTTGDFSLTARGYCALCRSGPVQAVGQVRLPLLPKGSCAREESRARPLRKLLPPHQWFVLSVTGKGLPS